MTIHVLPAAPPPPTPAAPVAPAVPAGTRGGSSPTPQPLCDGCWAGGGAEHPMEHPAAAAAAPTTTAAIARQHGGGGAAGDAGQRNALVLGELAHAEHRTPKRRQYKHHHHGRRHRRHRAPHVPARPAATVGDEGHYHRSQQQQQQQGSCALSAWGVWGACSARCGGGVAIRHRLLLRPPCSAAAPPQLRQVRSCGRASCPAKCRRVALLAWGACSHSCGAGVQVRFALEAQGGCPFEHARLCNTVPCPP